MLHLIQQIEKMRMEEVVLDIFVHYLPKSSVSLHAGNYFWVRREICYIRGGKHIMTINSVFLCLFLTWQKYRFVFINIVSLYLYLRKAFLSHFVGKLMKDFKTNQLVC